MTPQTMENDINIGLIDSERVCLVVIDEAHRSAGQYSYVNLILGLQRQKARFRVLALSASPGKNV